MKKYLTLLLLFTGCTSGMYLRYNYNKALQNLPQCSKIHAINNDYIAFSMVEQSTNEVYTNYYKAYYSMDGKITKITKN